MKVILIVMKKKKNMIRYIIILIRYKIYNFLNFYTNIKFIYNNMLFKNDEANVVKRLYIFIANKSKIKKKDEKKVS